MPLAHISTPGHSGTVARAGSLFNPGGGGPKVPDPSPGFVGTTPQFQAMSIVGILNVWSGATPSSSFLTNPFVVSVGVNQWLVIAVDPSTPTKVWWQSVTRNASTGLLTLGTAHTASDSGYSGSSAQYPAAIVSNDGTFGWAGATSSNYVRSVIFDSTYGSVSFVDFTLPSPYATGPALVRPPILLNRNLGFVAAGAAGAANGAVFAFNPTTGALLSTYSYSSPTSPSSPADLAVLSADSSGVTMLTVGTELTVLKYNSSGILSSSLPGNAATPGRYPNFGQLNANTAALSGYILNLLFVAGGYVAVGVNIGDSQYSRTFFTLSGPGPGYGGYLQFYEINSMWNATGGIGPSDLAGACSPYYNSNVVWQQTFNTPGNLNQVGQPTGWVQFTSYPWAAPNTAPTSSSIAPTVPYATANLDGSYPVANPWGMGGNLEGLPTIGSADSQGNVLWYTQLLATNYPSWHYSSNAMVVW